MAYSQNNPPRLKQGTFGAVDPATSPQDTSVCDDPHRPQEHKTVQRELPLGPITTQVRTTDLKLHKSISSNRIEPDPVQLHELQMLGESLFETPIRINQRNEIIDGQKRWLIAKRTGRDWLKCEISRLNDEDTLKELLKNHLPGSSLNPFCRILIALEMEKFHEKRAHDNRVLGGEKKQLLFLADAERANVRTLVARDAGVSPSAVRQVKIILRSNPCEELLAALRSETVRINRGYQLCGFPLNIQRNALSSKNLRRSNREKAEQLVVRLAPKSDQRDSVDAITHILIGLRRLPDDPLLALLQSQIAVILQTIDALLNAPITAPEREKAQQNEMAKAHYSNNLG
jgi:hypothetical protein